MRTLFIYFFSSLFAFGRALGLSVTNVTASSPPTLVPIPHRSTAVVRRPEGHVSHPVFLWTIEELLKMDDGLPVRPSERILEKSFVVNVHDRFGGSKLRFMVDIYRNATAGQNTTYQEVHITQLEAGMPPAPSPFFRTLPQIEAR